MSEREITFEQVEREHVAGVKQAAHWAYLAGVLGLSTLAMLALIAFLGQT